jgi:hypothetical protein
MVAEDAESLGAASPSSATAATAAAALDLWEGFNLEVSGSPSLPVHSTSFFQGIYGMDVIRSDESVHIRAPF